jgi:hypothetical protein
MKQVDIILACFFVLFLKMDSETKFMQNYSAILMSTAYLPSIEYMAYLSRNENITIEKEETYPKQTYRNRCKILAANGVLILSIPVRKNHGNSTKTKDITIINSNNWFTNHWRAISSAYSSSPFFLYYKDELEQFFLGKYDSLLKYNTELTNKLLTLTNIKCELKYSESFTAIEKLQESSVADDKPQNDLRYYLNPKNQVNSENFKEYMQVFANKFSFKPNLSFIDLLFNIGPEAKDYLKTVKL